MKRILTSLLLAVAICGGLLTLTGCKTATLDPSGVYQGDMLLYQADNVIRTSYDSVRAFVRWESTNHDQVKATMPDATQAANYLRKNYPLWHQAALNARTVYTTAKTAANKDALTLALTVLKNSIDTANTWLARGSAIANPTPALEN